MVTTRNKINNSISKENASLCVKRHRTLKEFTVKAFHGHFHQFSIGKGGQPLLHQANLRYFNLPSWAREEFYPKIISQKRYVMLSSEILFLPSLPNLHCNCCHNVPLYHGRNTSLTPTFYQNHYKLRNYPNYAIIRLGAPPENAVPPKDININYEFCLVRQKHDATVPETSITAELDEFDCLPNLIQQFDSDAVVLPCTEKHDVWTGPKILFHFHYFSGWWSAIPQIVVSWQLALLCHHLQGWARYSSMK